MSSDKAELAKLQNITGREEDSIISTLEDNTLVTTKLSHS